MAERILVTGGAGFVGAALVRALIGRGEAVTVIDSGAAAGYASLDGLDLTVVRGDILDPAALRQAVAGAGAVVHLAARTSVPASIADPAADFAVNVDGSLKLLEAARAGGVARFVFASSNAVVAGHESPLHERLEPRPVAPYGAAKAAVEAYLIAYGRAYGMTTTALRFANAYGPWSEHKSSVVPLFVRQALSSQQLVVHGSGAQTRDFVHVDDTARAICACLDAPTSVVGSAVFQIGTGVETSVLELANIVLAATGGAAGQIVSDAASAGDVARNYSDITLAREVLGWEPRVRLTDGIAATVDWYRRRL